MAPKSSSKPKHFTMSNPFKMSSIQQVNEYDRALRRTSKAKMVGFERTTKWLSVVDELKSASSDLDCMFNVGYNTIQLIANCVLHVQNYYTLNV